MRGALDAAERHHEERDAAGGEVAADAPEHDPSVAGVRDAVENHAADDGAELSGGAEVEEVPLLDLRVGGAEVDRADGEPGDREELRVHRANLRG